MSGGGTGPGGPEWISVTIVDVVMRSTDAGPVRMQCQIGIVRSPDGEVQIAARVVGRGPQWFVLSPQSASRAMGALRDAIRQAGLGDTLF